MDAFSPTTRTQPDDAKAGRPGAARPPEAPGRAADRGPRGPKTATVRGRSSDATEAPAEDPAGGRRWLRASLAGATAVWLAAIGLLYALLPPSPDQFELTYVAWRLNQGGVPYETVIDMNWPAAFWLHQAIAWLPQGPLFPWRVLDYLLMLAGVGATAGWLWRTPGLGRPAALAVLLAYPMLYADPRAYWFAGQRDAVCFHLSLLAAALQMASVRAAGPSPGHSRRFAACAIATGAVVAFSTLVKPLALLAAPALLLASLVSPEPWTVKARRFGWNVAGGLGAWALAAIALALQGAPLQATIDAAWTYNLTGQKNTNLSLGGLLAIGATYTWDALKLIAIAAAATLVFATIRGQRGGAAADARRLAWCFVPAAILFYVLQGKGFVYHLAWVQGLVSVVALVAAGAALPVAARGFARGRMAVPRGQSVAAALVVLAVLASVGIKSLAHRPPLAVLAGAMPRAEFLAHQAAGPGTTFAEAEALAAELAAALPEGANPEDHPVLVYGDAVSINLLSGRPLTNAFYYPRVLTAMHRGGEADDSPIVHRWDERFARELRASTPPKVFICDAVQSEARAAGVPAAAVLDAWLAERYRPAGRVGGLLRYERKP